MTSVDQYITRIEALYNKGNTNEVEKLTSQAEAKLVEDTKKQQAIGYEKIAINGYFLLEDFGELERVIRKAKGLGLPKIKIPLPDESEESYEHSKRARNIMEEVYGPDQKGESNASETVIPRRRKPRPRMVLEAKEDQ